MQIQNERADLKFCFTLSGKPMEVYTAIISFYQGARTDGPLGLNRAYPSSVEIRKGDERLLNKSVFAESFEWAEQHILDWITEQEMANAARNGDTD